MKQLYNFITIKQPPYRWVVREDIKKIITRELIGREAILSAQSPLKENNVRSLFVMSIPQTGEFFVKHYKLNDWWSVLKASLGRSKALNELLMANYLHNRDIPSVQPLAVLERQKWGFTVDAFLFLEKINQAVTLKDFFSNPASPAGRPGQSDCLSRRDVLNRLGQLVRRVHQVDFFHQDLHLGNVLLNFSFEGEPQLYLIDLHRSRISGGLSDSRKIYNLAQISYSLNLVRPFTDALRFLKAYRQLDFRPQILKKLVRRISVLTAQFRLRHYDSRAKRCLKNSSEFMIYKNDDYRIFLRRGRVPEKFIELVERHKNLLEQSAVQLFKHNKARSISIQTGDNNQLIFIKEYRYSLLGRLKNLGRAHAARRSWVAARGLALRRIDTPEPLALVEPRSGLIKNSYLLLRAIPEARPANQFVTEFFGEIKSPRDLFRRKKEFIKQLAGAVQKLHRQGVFHADLKANNILVDGESEHLEFYFIDLDLVKFAREIRRPQRIKNLAQLNAAMPGVLSRADRLRFFKEYTAALPGYDWSRKKDLVKRIMKITIARRHVWPRPFGQHFSWLANF